MQPPLASSTSPLRNPCNAWKLLITPAPPVQRDQSLSLLAHKLLFMLTSLSPQTELFEWKLYIQDRSRWRVHGPEVSEETAAGSPQVRGDTATSRTQRANHGQDGSGSRQHTRHQSVTQNLCFSPAPRYFRFLPPEKQSCWFCISLFLEKK